MWVQTGDYELASLYWLIAVIVIFVIAVIALIVAGRALSGARAAGASGAVHSQMAPGATGTQAADQPLPEAYRMLDERYAKGEISREEYIQRQTDLQSKA
jgi:uncharacterized membrane protein